MYAAEWPCCHDPLRLCPLFHDLLPRPPHGCARRQQPISRSRHRAPSRRVHSAASHLGPKHQSAASGRRSEPSQSALVRAASARCVSSSTSHAPSALNFPPTSPPLLPHPLPCSLARGATSSECSLPLPLMISSRAPCTPNCARTILRAPSSFPVSRLKAPARPPYRAPHLIAAVADGSLADAPMHRRSVVASPMMHRRSVVASPMMQCVCLLGDAPTLMRTLSPMAL